MRTRTLTLSDGIDLRSAWCLNLGFFLHIAQGIVDWITFGFPRGTALFLGLFVCRLLPITYTMQFSDLDQRKSKRTYIQYAALLW